MGAGELQRSVKAIEAHNAVDAALLARRFQVVPYTRAAVGAVAELEALGMLPVSLASVWLCSLAARPNHS